MQMPVVSVVMATYNRSNILQYSIGSLLRGCYQDWELIVVGDCCTDDTEQVVAGFKDPRIRFVNLSNNYGEQTGPNNEGIALARGRYIAFLNHDDIWCQNHLQSNLDALEQLDADLVFSQGLLVTFDAPVSLTGAISAAVQSYRPWMIVPATLWLFKKTLVDKVGAWQLSKDIYGIPSQDWLYRAHRIKAQMFTNPVVTTIIINAGTRNNAYSERQFAEHQYWYGVYLNPRVFSQCISAAFGGHLQNSQMMSIPLALRRLMGIITRKFLLKLKIWPPDILYWLRYYRKGSYIQYLRRKRGLPSK